VSSQLASLRACGKYQKGMQGSGTLIHNIIYLQFERKEKKEKKRKEKENRKKKRKETNNLLWLTLSKHDKYISPFTTWFAT